MPDKSMAIVDVVAEVTLEHGDKKIVLKCVGVYEWGAVYADRRDPNAGGASHRYVIAKYIADGNASELEAYADVQFQHGPRSVDCSVVGALDDHLLAISQDRLEAFQDGPFAHESNAMALGHVKAAREALRARAEERRARGVLGKNEK